MFIVGVGIMLIISLMSIMVGGYISYKNYRMSRDAIVDKIRVEEEQLLREINRIGVDELQTTQAGQELLEMLAPSDVNRWQNPGYKHIAIETARYYEAQSRIPVKDPRREYAHVELLHQKGRR